MTTEQDEELLLDTEHAKVKGFNSVIEWYLACLNAEINILLDPELRTDDRLDKLAVQAKVYIEKIAKVLKHRLPLFQLGSFTLHSGSISRWKIDCDALTDGDWEAIAYMIQERHKFGKVIGIPSGGLKLAKALEQYATEGATLIVDDVLTTGKSMEEMKATCKGEVIGVVVFARNECPNWVQPLFSMVYRHRLDRPELREKIGAVLEAWQDEGKDYVVCHSFSGIAYEILALFPDIEESEARLELIRRLTARCEQLRGEVEGAVVQARKEQMVLDWAQAGKDVEEAKKQEAERLLNKCEEIVDGALRLAFQKLFTKEEMAELTELSKEILVGAKDISTLWQALKEK